MKLVTNKLTLVLVIVALIVVGFIALRARSASAPPSNASPLDPAPAAAPATTDSAPQKSGGLLGSVKDAQAAAKPGSADADTPTETLRTLTSEVQAARSDMQKVSDENRALRTQVAQTQIDREAIKNELRNELRTELASNTQATGANSGATPAATANAGGNATAGAGGALNPNSILEQMPTGFGFDAARGQTGATGNGTAADPTGANGAGTPTASASARVMRTVLPQGVSIQNGAEGKGTLVRTTAGAQPLARSAGTLASDPAALTSTLDDKAGLESAAPKKKDKAFFTIPENATLLGVKAMTAIVGRIPVDGRVQDPMQFKLILGPENLAANSHMLPRDLSGVIVSGIAIGDMNLSCSEGLIQSLTFVFNDGVIRTVSQRTGGVTQNTLAGGGGGASGGGMTGLAQASKLGYLSDVHGNPCIAGKFVTNAPAYLTDVIGLKTLSLAGKAAAMAQTTTTSSTGFGGTSSTSSVTGNKGTFILGEAASGATDEVTSWLTRRMGNSFDAIVTMAGADVVVNIDQEIAIDKTVNARRIDYGRIDAALTRSQSARGSHGLD